MANTKPILPGKILEKDFLIPRGISAYRLAQDIKISATRVSEILKGKRGITVGTALRLSRYFGNSAEFWVGIQAAYEIKEERQKLKAQLAEIRPLKKTKA